MNTYSLIKIAESTGHIALAGLFLLLAVSLVI